MITSAEKFYDIFLEKGLNLKVEAFWAFYFHVKISYDNDKKLI